MSVYLTIFGKPRYLGLVDIGEKSVEQGTWISIESMRGRELGIIGGCLSQEQEARYRKACESSADEGQSRCGEPNLQNVVFHGIAERSEMEEYEMHRKEEESVFLRARTILNEHQLAMKLVDVEYLLDRKKLFFYFTSEQRVDFRAYVRDLAREFKTRIELRQIGVRDEAKVVKGLGPCGRRCCCSYWLHGFVPICIKMVKEQNLALNPTKISGICGRLMCCMSYEHPMYRELWKKLPNPGTKFKTPDGNYVILGVDLQKESFRVRRPDGAELVIPVGKYSEFNECVMRGEEWKFPETALDEPVFQELFGEMSDFDEGVRSSRKGKASVAQNGNKVKAKKESETKKPSRTKSRTQKPKKKPVQGKEGTPGTSKRRRRKKKVSASSGGKKPSDVVATEKSDGKGTKKNGAQRPRKSRKPDHKKKAQDSESRQQPSRKKGSGTARSHNKTKKDEKREE